MTGPVEEDEPRAEELVAQIYGQKLSLEEKGRTPREVILSMADWRRIRAWHLAMGQITHFPQMDYITEDHIFGLEVLIDQRETLLVR